MDIHTFKKLIDSNENGKVSLLFKNQSANSTILSRNDFFFFDEVIHFLNTMIGASISKYVVKGGVVLDDPTVRFICHALDEDIKFPGIWLFWANALEFEVTEMQFDISAVPHDEKKPPNHDVKVGDFGIRAAATLIMEAMDKADDLIKDKYPGGWFDNWPDVLRIAKLLRNASAHNGKWHIQKEKNREHYQYEKFVWPRANLIIQMRNEDGNVIDEGNDALPYFNGADLIILLIKINNLLKN